MRMHKMQISFDLVAATLLSLLIVLSLLFVISSAYRTQSVGASVLPNAVAGAGSYYNAMKSFCIGCEG